MAPLKPTIKSIDITRLKGQLGADLSRTGFFKPMASKSYGSYGKVNHKESALIPEGRILIDTARSFVYAESGLKGVLTASRLSGLFPNLTPASRPALSPPATRPSRPCAGAWPCPSESETQRL